jgi:anti-sigma factor RsiW
MTCQQAIELLPWFLNGTLKGQESEAVRGHLETCEACRAALAETREAGQIFAQHLPTEALVALAYGERPDGMDPALAERHLDTCPQCAAELELTRMSRRLEEEDRIVPFPVPRPEPRRENPVWRRSAMAASLVGLISLGGWFHAAQRSRLADDLEARNQAVQVRQAELQAGMQEIQGQFAELAKPQINTPVTDLRPLRSEEVVRGGPSPEISLPARQIVTAILQASPEIRSPGRDVAILDETGKPVWQQPGLNRNDSLEFTITLHPGFLKPGRYTIQLYETVNGQRVPRESYKIRVE